jgi:hypothetical protein
MSVTAVHPDHDELLIVRAAEGDPDPRDDRLAQEQLDACVDCRALFADVATIRAATTATTLRVPPRPRSFRIDPDALERMRMPAWRRWLARLGTPRYDALRPLAGAVAGLGVAVIVLSSVTVPFGLSGAQMARDASSPAASQGTSEVYAVPGNAPAPDATSSGAPGRTNLEGSAAGSGDQLTSPAPAAASAPPATAAPAAPAAPAGPPKATDSAGGQSPTAFAPSPSVPVGLIGSLLLLAGVTVFVLQTAARRTAGR